MKIDLPQENWNDLAGFVPRIQLGQIVPLIGDRHFAWIIQSFLHEFGQISLGTFKIDFPMNGNAPAGSYSDVDMGWPLPDVPMPSNIANFKQIHLCCFDESVLKFLQQFQPNSLLSNVNLEFKECKSGALMAFLTKFMPLLESVDSITDVGQSFVSLLEHSPLANTLLTSATVFDILIKDAKGARIGNWLATPRPDGKPRLLFLKPYRYYDYYGDETDIFHTCSPLIEHVKQVDEEEEDFDLTISRFPIFTNEEEWHDEMAQYLISDPDNRYDDVGQYAKKEYRKLGFRQFYTTAIYLPDVYKHFLFVTDIPSDEEEVFFQMGVPLLSHTKLFLSLLLK